MRRDLLIAGAGLAGLLSLSVWFFLSHGYTLYYGDDEAHLNIARSVVDSRTPGPDQLGTVWLPVPHVLMLPFVGRDTLWHSGLAGAIPAAICMGVAGLFLFASVRFFTSSRPAAWSALALFTLNPNILYLASIPMTEAVMFAGVCGLLFSTVWFGRTGSLWALISAAFFSNWASLTRYEGWFLVPFVTAYIIFAARRYRWWFGVVFAVLASTGPAAWLAHNWWYTGNALDFYNGPYSAQAIQGGRDYPGKNDWGKAWLYYRTAVDLAAGRFLVWIGLAGVIASLAKRAFWPVLFCALPPAFYILSLHGSGTPIFVPTLWPSSYYNTRYGLAAMPLLAVASGALAAWGAPAIRTIAGLMVTAIVVAPWIAFPHAENWICWKESKVNSESRREWARQGADFLRSRYRPGDGVLTSFGDQIAILREAGIPMREALDTANQPQWMGAVQAPRSLLRENWAVSLDGDDVSKAMQRASAAGLRYVPAAVIEVPGAPKLRIYRRLQP